MPTADYLISMKSCETLLLYELSNICPLCDLTSAAAAAPLNVLHTTSHEEWTCFTNQEKKANCHYA